MCLYCLLGIVCFVAAWKRALYVYERDLKQLREELVESLDYSENEIKQAHVATIDRVFNEHNKNV